jgi:hypothetical protein
LQVFVSLTFLVELLTPSVITIVSKLLLQLSFFLQFPFMLKVFFLPSFDYVFVLITLILIIVSNEALLTLVVILFPSVFVHSVFIARVL